MALTSHDKTIAGLATRWYEGGDPAAETVVFIHDGAPGADALLAFGAVADGLSDEYHVVAPDLLGWGGSAKVHHFDQSLYAPRVAHLRALLAELSVNKAHFVGNSFGGSLILRALTGVGAGLPALSAISIAGTGGPWRSQTGMSALANYATTPEEARRVSDLVVGAGRATGEHVAHRLANSHIPGHWESLRAWGLRNPDAAPHDAPADEYPANLASVEVPILLVSGAHDVMVEPGWADNIVAAAPKVQHLTLDTGHSPNIEDPDTITKVVRDFVRTAPPQR